MRVCAVVGALFFCSQLAEIPWRSALRGYDNTFNYLWLRSAMVDGDWDFQNDIEQCNTLTPAHRASALTLPRPETGLLPNKYGIGWALVTTPFYLVADAIVAGGRALGLWHLERDGFNAVYQICVQLGHLGLAVLALWLAARAVSAWISSVEAAWIGVVTVWAASPLFYYQTVNLSMSHGVAFLAVALMAWGVAKAASGEKPAQRWWLVAGAGWGLAVITRFQLVVFAVAAVPVLFGRGPALERRGDGAKSRCGPAAHAMSYAARGAAFAVGAAPFVSLQLWAWHVVYGKWLVFGYGAEGESFHWGRPELLNTLFSTWHGLFYWHPFLLVGAVGLLVWAWRERGMALGWAIAWAATAYVSASWWCWWFAAAFGNRSFDAALLPLMAGVAWFWKRANERWRRVLFALAVIAGGWNFYVATLYRAGAIPRNEPVTWMQMLHAATRLPSALRF